MKKNVLIILIFVVISIIMCTSVNRIMIRSVENVKKDFFNVVCGKKEEGIDYGLLSRYDYSKYFEIKTVDNLRLEVESSFHNFKEGYMNVVYSFDINKNDINHSVGAGGVKAKWYIRKDENRWIIYDIDESP